MPEIEYITWHGGNSTWFTEFTNRMFSLYRFDTGGMVGGDSFDWQLDLMKPKDRKLVISDIMRLVEKYHLSTKTEHYYPHADTLHIYFPGQRKAYSYSDLIDSALSKNQQRLFGV